MLSLMFCLISLTLGKGVGAVVNKEAARSSSTGGRYSAARS